MNIHQFADTPKLSSDGSWTFRWRVAGVASEQLVLQAVLAASPTIYAGLERQEHPEIDCIYNDLSTGKGEWVATVRYAKPDERKPSEIGSVTISATTQGGTVHITQAKELVEQKTVAGADAVAVDNAINVSKTGPGGTVSGIDIIVPVFNFTVTKVFAGDALPNIANIVQLTGTVNNAAFTVKDTKTGMTLLNQANTCLYNGCNFGAARGDGGVEFAYSFSSLPNRTNITDIPGITIGSKRAWDYLWSLYQDRKSSDGKVVLQRPTNVYVMRVYEYASFSGLGI